MLAQRLKNDIRQGYHSWTVLPVLDWPEHGLTSNNLHQLPVNSQGLAEKVDPVDGQSKGLRDTHACSRSEDNQRVRDL